MQIRETSSFVLGCVMGGAFSAYPYTYYGYSSYPSAGYAYSSYPSYETSHYTQASQSYPYYQGPYASSYYQYGQLHEYGSHANADSSHEATPYPSQASDSSEQGSNSQYRRIKELGQKRGVKAAGKTVRSLGRAAPFAQLLLQGAMAR